MKTLPWTLLFCLLAGPVSALNYSNPELGFKAVLPDNLQDVSVSVGIPGALISLGKWDPPKERLIKLVSLQDLGGTIGREDLSKQPGKPANVTLEKAGWKTFGIDVFKIIETVGGVTNVTFNAQVPLKPHAIQLTVSGPAGDEAVLRQEIHTIVGTIDGASNWLTTEERVARGASGLGRLIAFGCVLVILISWGARKLFRGSNMN
jgi:hypothetical protein